MYRIWQGFTLAVEQLSIYFCIRYEIGHSQKAWLALTTTTRSAIALVCYYFGDMGNVVWHTSYKLLLFNYTVYNNPVAVALVVVNVAVSPECVSQQIYFNTDHHHHCNHYHRRQRHCRYT
uniref:Uncharacterized protein n=1 Tax=Glossina brevipalpis TaxID=37001 RepID=A0A1A9WFJ5_9MUSC